MSYAQHLMKQLASLVPENTRRAFRLSNGELYQDADKLSLKEMLGHVHANKTAYKSVGQGALTLEYAVQMAEMYVNVDYVDPTYTAQHKHEEPGHVRDLFGLRNTPN